MSVVTNIRKYEVSIEKGRRLRAGPCWDHSWSAIWVIWVHHREHVVHAPLHLFIRFNLTNQFPHRVGRLNLLSVSDPSYEMAQQKRWDEQSGDGNIMEQGTHLLLLGWLFYTSTKYPKSQVPRNGSILWNHPNLFTTIIVNRLGFAEVCTLIGALDK